MNQTCKVCGEPAAGFHFGAFTCEGCKSFFGRSYNNLSSISECKNNGKCVIDKKNRTTCKACRLRKCYTVGMSKGGSRYGRRSNWFKIHCLLQEQQQQAVEAASKAAAASGNTANPAAFGDMAAAVAAQQQFSQRSSHLAAAAPHLGYPAYLTPEMSAAPFMSAAALPFFSMMNSLPSMAAANSPPSAFQMPPHLLFPSYHPAAAAAAADAAYRTEMFKHRQSVDSAASGESQQHSPRFSPSNHSIHSLTHEDSHMLHHTQLQQQQQHSEQLCARQSPILSVSVDDDVDEQEQEHNSLHSQQTSVSPASSQHHIHSPIAIRASPREQPALAPPPPTIATATATAPPPPPTPEPSFAVKMQSLSPVSICSITHETTPPTPHPLEEEQPMNQDCPMDLSMKTSRSSVQSDSDMLSETSEEERQQQNMRRKFFQMESSTENSENSSDDCDANKRQKLNENGYSTFSNTHHAQRGIVCV